MADPITTGITAAAAAWVWDKFGKDITDKAKDTAKNKWKQFRWRDAAEKYRAKIKKHDANHGYDRACDAG